MFDALANAVKNRNPGTGAIENVKEYISVKIGLCVGRYVARSPQTLADLVSGTNSQ